MSDVTRPRHSECPAYRIGTASASRTGESSGESTAPHEVAADHDDLVGLAAR